MDVAQFRIDFPEFKDPARFPPVIIEGWASFAADLLNKNRLGKSYDKGLQLFTAHTIAIAEENRKTAAAGGTPGTPKGLVTTKTVGSVSVSYDVSGLSDPKNAEWNRTSYGQLFAMLISVKGAGWAQV